LTIRFPSNVSSVGTTPWMLPKPGCGLWGISGSVSAAINVTRNYGWPCANQLSAIAKQLNERPRKTLLFQTPAEKFAECVAAIS
jgi:hypothetical protein